MTEIEQPSHAKEMDQPQGPSNEGMLLKTVAPDAGVDTDQMIQWILDIRDRDRRETALLELSKKREAIPELPVWLWQSYGTMTCLLQEVISVYSAIVPPLLSATQSNRVCNALALMQCVAAHADTRKLFLEAKIPLFLYPFLHTTKNSRPFEYLRLTSLGVIGAMVKTDEKDVIKFLLSTEIIPLCLRIMEQGTELSRTVSTFILQKILLDDMGLDYVCQTYERFSHVAIVLGKVVIHLTNERSARLFKHVVRCYARLSDNNRAVQALAQCLPEQLRDDTFREFLDQDRSTEHFCRTLHENIYKGCKARPDSTGRGMTAQAFNRDPSRDAISRKVQEARESHARLQHQENLFDS